jgi:hypothetical protein
MRRQILLQRPVPPKLRKRAVIAALDRAQDAYRFTRRR